MNAVATPPRSVKAGRVQTTPSDATATRSDWKSLLDFLLKDLREVSADVAEIADKMGSDEPTIGRLLDSALDDLHAAMRGLDVRTVTQVECENAYLTLFKPLAYLQGASAMAKALEVDIFSGAIDKAAVLLDEAHNGLDGEALGRLLPEVRAAKSTPAPTNAPGDDETSAELAYYRCGEVVAVMRTAAREDSSIPASEVCWAVATLADIAKDNLEPRGPSDPVGMDDVRAAGTRLSQAIAVCDLLMVESESELVRAGYTLLADAARLVDDAERETSHAKRV